MILAQKWIKTEEMLENLSNEPGEEYQYARYLGPILRSTVQNGKMNGIKC